MSASPRRSTASQDAYLEIMRAHEALRASTDALLKTAGLSQPQYNALRILRGGPAEGLPCAEIGARLVNRLPDVTRLVDRMEAGGLVSRHRCPEDRRVVRIRLTAAGRAKVDALDEPILRVHGEQFAALKIAEIEALASALRALRERT